MIYKYLGGNNINDFPQLPKGSKIIHFGELEKNVLDQRIQKTF